MSCVTRMTLHQCLDLHLLFPILNHFLNPPYHHWLVDDLSSQSSYDTVKYKRAWHRLKGIRYSILYSGESPDARIRAFPIALNHREIASIMVVTGTILPKRYANVITRHEQKKKMLSHATSIGNK